MSARRLPRSLGLGSTSLFGSEPHAGSFPAQPQPGHHRDTEGFDRRFELTGSLHGMIRPPRYSYGSVISRRCNCYLPKGVRPRRRRRRTRHPNLDPTYHSQA